MKYILFLIIYSILWSISILPFRVLYFLSDIVYFLLYKVIGYRVKTVRANLKLAFPELNDIERKEIEKNFYRHLCDLFLEMIKTITISEKELDKRFAFRSEEHTSELQSRPHLVCRLLLEKKKKYNK